MPPGGAWPPALREPVGSVDPPTVPLLLAGFAPHPGPDPGPDRSGAAPPDETQEGWRARLVAAVVPAAWRGARVDPGRPGATALALVAALAAAVAAAGVWLDRPRSEPVAALPAVVVTSAPEAPAPVVGPSAAPTTAAPSGPLVLSVSGKVARPGLVEVPDGSRVADALEAAGGALPGTDLSTLNLARRVLDGEQIAVGVPAAVDAAPAWPAGAVGGAAPGEGAAGAGGATTGPVDLNTATQAQLDALPGVGPVTAQRILEWRRRNGRFTRIEQLREIEGIGERRFAQLRELVVV
ncbi:ComEA family DNA-binding protein [Pseudonocardia sp. KRD-184]|uniref:ComEA family DNA-binding protein n=3 Tax=Pseudonocardia oceani TaxID=2792013 RepID=A0ABS6U504_9PSEU|nr:ComEA family DNA-binding protein [Pseudonocardia oceani]MBW0123458.1 ComEA family DNA-binding protein [Pseudonocardia oceani]MBW0127313.1 ComEA family DNA-binding protein [Pseudonocardia oceani]